MKKIFTLLAIVGLLTLQSCTTSGSFEIAPVASTEAFEITTSFNSTNNFGRLVSFNPRIYSSDVVLVYRLAGSNSQGDVWQLLPETHYYNDGTLNFGYKYDYTNTDVDIYMIGSNLQNVIAEFRLNQVFRIVIVPASYAASINKNNYADVINALNLKEDQIQKISF